MALDIKRRHPQYEMWAETADFLWSSYLGGRDYQAGKFLDQYPREYDAVYAARKNRAYLLNHFAATVDAYVSSVFRRDPVRQGEEDERGNPTTDLSPQVQAFIDDATGDGDDLNQFSRDVTTFALAAERVFVAVDVIDNVPQRNGIPYAYIIHPSNLLDFSVEPQTGEIRWAITLEMKIEDEDPYTERKELTQYRLWTPAEWVVFDDKGQQVDAGRNGAGRVPIIHVPGYKVRLSVYDIGLINKRIYNLCSQLDEVNYNTTFPMLYVPGGEGVSDLSYVETELSANGDVSPMAVGPAKVLELPIDKEFNSIIPGYLAPPEGPARILMDERLALVESIRALAGLERRDPDAISPQSGVAKAYDFRETNERLVSLAQLAEDFEIELFDLVGAYGTPTEVNVSYNKDFQVRDFQAMTEQFEKLQNFKLPSLVKKRAALDYSEVLFEEASEEEKREMREAVENMTEFDQPDPATQFPPRPGGQGFPPQQPSQAQQAPQPQRQSQTQRPSS
jgi:hypothetical protein